MMGCTEQIMFTTAHVVLAQENVCFILILGARDSKTEDLVKSFPQSFDENYLYICFFFQFKVLENNSGNFCRTSLSLDYANGH